MPDELSQQLAPIRDLVRGFSVPLLERQGMEADDVIGSIARRFEKEGVRVVILSGDKDFMQLVSDRIVLLDTMRDRLYDEKGVRERFGVGPERVVDILGLTGDTSDNVPGVPGIGDKTARKLVEGIRGNRGDPEPCRIDPRPEDPGESSAICGNRRG
jgi:DNA polymerase-1